jgi:hypothetical protein
MAVNAAVNAPDGGDNEFAPPVAVESALVLSWAVKPPGGGSGSGRGHRPGPVAAGQSEGEQAAQVQRGDAVVQP